jgi:hypothetical protein
MSKRLSDSKKYQDFRKKDQSGRSPAAVKNAVASNTGYYSGGAAPKVGVDKKSGPAPKKPASVSSGYRPKSTTLKQAKRAVRHAARRLR